MANKEKKNKTSPAMAVHVQDPNGDHHAVGIWDLHVYITRDGDGWFARGLEIDYAVQGDSITEVKRNFEVGLEGTIDLHLQMDGNIHHLLKFAPMEVIQEALHSRLKGAIKEYNQVSLHDIGSNTSSLPFDGISYLVADAGIAA
jgi:hypothetical protein